MKRGLVISAVILAAVLVSFSAFVSAQAAWAYGAKPSAAFNPDQDMAQLTIPKAEAPLPAPIANIPREDSREVDCQIFEDTGVPYCAIEGFAPFAFTPGAIITINAENNQLIISAPKDKEITYAFNDGGALVLSPGQSLIIKELPNIADKIRMRLNEALGGRYQYRRTPTAVAAVRGSPNLPEKEDLANASPVDKKTLVDYISDFISSRILRSRTRDNVITPAAVAAVRGTPNLPEKGDLAAN